MGISSLPQVYITLHQACPVLVAFFQTMLYVTCHSIYRMVCINEFQINVGLAIIHKWRHHHFSTLAPFLLFWGNVIIGYPFMFFTLSFLYKRFPMLLLFNSLPLFDDFRVYVQITLKYCKYLRSQNKKFQNGYTKWKLKMICKSILLEIDTRARQVCFWQFTWLCWSLTVHFAKYMY